MIQIYSPEKIKQYTVIELEGKFYKVISCFDNEFFGNGFGFNLIVEYIGDMKQ